MRINITFGFFDFQTRKYDPKDFNNVELVSMHGTIAWKNDTIAIHAHGVVADKLFRLSEATFFLPLLEQVQQKFYLPFTINASSERKMKVSALTCWI